MFAFRSSTVSFSVGVFCCCCCCFFVLADLFTLFVSSDEPRSQSRARRDSSLGVVRDGGKKLLDLGKFPCGNTNQKVN